MTLSTTVAAEGLLTIASSHKIITNALAPSGAFSEQTKEMIKSAACTGE